MTGPDGGFGEQPHDQTPPFPRPAEPQPWRAYQQPPANYPDYPYPPQPPFGYPPPPPQAGPYGYGGPPPAYPGPYDRYQAYGAAPRQTNGLAVASLITSIAGVVLGIPLAIFCYVGWLIPVTGAVLGAVALSQIKRTNQPGRGLALAGIIVGSATAALLVLAMILIAAAAFHSPMFVR
jgi:hypothetical protein